MKYALITVLLLICPRTLPSQQALTLDDALHIGISGSRMLRVSAEKAVAATARRNEVSSVLLPSLKIDAGYRRLSDVDPFEIRLPIFPQPVTIAPTVLDNYSLHAGIQQPLFTGFRMRSNSRAAEELARASRSDLQADEDDLRASIIAAYWMVYQAGLTKEVVDQNVARLESYLADTRRLMDAGLVTVNDQLRIEVQLNSARLSRIDAGNDYQVAMMNLNNLLAQPLETDWSLASSPDTVGRITGDLGTLQDSALVLRPEIAAMSARVQASKASLTAARGGYWPQVYLSGNYYYQRPNARYQPTRDEFLSTWDIGLQLQMDVWNWGQTSAQAEQAGAAVRQNEIQFDQLKENVTLDVRRSYLLLLRGDEKVSVAKTAIGQAEENVRSITEKYRTGLSTSTEVIDASVALLQARLNYSGALVERENARARLAKASGEWHK